MSYSTSGLGFIELLITGALVPSASGVQACTGAVMKDGKCCDVSTYTNGTYAYVKGAPSMERKNEQRINLALRLITSDKLQAFAWDNDASLSPSLTQSIQRASRSFKMLFPYSRWKKWMFKKIVPDVDGQCGSVDTWIVDHNYKISPSQQSLISQLKGSRSMKEWELQAREVKASVPGANPRSVVTHMPRFEDLISIENGQVTPSPWLDVFIGTFDRKLSLIKAPAIMKMIEQTPTFKLTKAPGSPQMYKPKPSFKLTRGPVQPKILMSPQMSPPQPETPPEMRPKEEMTTTTKIMIGAGAVAVVGGVAYLAMR